MKGSLVRARIDEDLKDRATAVLRDNGLEMSDAIRLFLTQVVHKGGLPFSVRAPQRVGRRNESRLAKELDLDLLNEHRLLSPTERLEMFLSHSRQMAQLQTAGEALRRTQA